MHSYHARNALVKFRRKIERKMYFGTVRVYAGSPAGVHVDTNPASGKRQGGGQHSQRITNRPPCTRRA